MPDHEAGVAAVVAVVAGVAPGREAGHQSARVGGVRVHEVRRHGGAQGGARAQEQNLALGAAALGGDTVTAAAAVGAGMVIVVIFTVAVTPAALEENMLHADAYSQHACQGSYGFLRCCVVHLVGSVVVCESELFRNNKTQQKILL